MDDAVSTIAFTLPNAVKLILCTFAGATVTGLAGFGATILTLPLLAAFFPFRAAVTVRLFPPIAGMAYLSWKLRHDVVWRAAGLLSAFGIAGVVLGTAVLRLAPGAWLLLGFGVLVLAVAVSNIVRPGRKRIVFRTCWPRTTLVGFLGGILAGAYGAPGPLLVLYAYHTNWSPHVAKAVCVVFFLAVATTRIPSYFLQHMVTREILIWSLILTPVSLAGVWLGHRLANRVDTETFKRIVYVVLAASGAMLCVKAFVH